MKKAENCSMTKKKKTSAIHWETLGSAFESRIRLRPPRRLGLQVITAAETEVGARAGAATVEVSKLYVASHIS